MAETGERRYPIIIEAMTLNDIAEYSGVKLSTLRSYHKQGQGGLPDPKATLAGRPVWERETIDHWLANRRGRGRPRTRRRLDQHLGSDDE